MVFRHGRIGTEPDGVECPAWGFWPGVIVARKSLSDQLSPDFLMSVELAGVHAFADRVAKVAKRWAPLDEEIDHVIIEREQGITPLTFRFEHDSLRANGFDDLADWRIRVRDGLYGHGDPPRYSIESCLLRT